VIQICLLTFFWDKAKNVWFRPFSLFFFKKWLKLQYDIQIGWNLCFTLNFVLNLIEIKPVFRAHFYSVKWTESHIFGIIWEKSLLIDMLNHILALGLVSYNFCMIPLACAWNFGSTNLKFSKTHCKSAFPELLHPKSRVQTSGIIQKLYETKPDAYMRFWLSVTWLFSQIIPKMWDSVHFTVWKWALKTGLISMKFKTKFNVKHKFHPIWMSYCNLSHFLKKNSENGRNHTFLALSQKKVSKQIWITLYLC